MAKLIESRKQKNALGKRGVNSGRYENLNSQTNDLLQRHNNYSNQANNISESIRSLKSQIDNFQSKINTHQGTISESKDIISNANKYLPKMKDAKGVLAKLKSSQYGEIRSEANTLYKKVINAIDDLERIKKSMQSFINSRQQSINNLQNEISTLKDRIERKQNEKDDFSTPDLPGHGLPDPIGRRLRM